MIKNIFNAGCAVFIALGVCCPVFAAVEKDAGSLFVEALNAYHAARYDEAVALNEAVIAKGFTSPALYYNLGNSYLKAGHLGKSLVNYLRSMALTPRDGDLRANLSFARSLVENYAPWPRGSALSFPQKDLSEEELQWFAFGAFALTGIFWLGGLYGGMQRKRIILGTGLLAAFAVYLIAAAVCGVIENGSKAVCVGRVEARFEPSLQATTYFKIPEGTEVKILREKDGWFKIERSDGKTGWIPAAPLERI